MNKPKQGVAIVGLGFVGLPLAMNFASRFNVFGIDIDNKKIDALQHHQSYLKDVSNEQLKRFSDEQKFVATYDFSVIRQVEAIIICVPTPLKEQQPDLSYVLTSLKLIEPYLQAGQLVVLESSTFPGTTEHYIAPRLQEAGFTIGTNLFVGYSPERIDPGNTQYSIKQIPKIVSGLTATCLEKTITLYETVFDRVVPVSSTQTAEFVKMFENSQRMVNISFINEISLLANKLNIDIWEAIDAAKTKPMGFHPYYPSAGIGGHCIPVDPHYLTWIGMQEGIPLTMINQAGLVNERMPHYVGSHVYALLQQQNIRPDRAHVGVVGLTYKKDVDDIRESASVKVIQLLQKRGITIHAHDDVFQGTLPDGVSRFKVDKQSMNHLDVTLILVDHSAINWLDIVANSKHIIDTRNVTRGMHDHHITRI